MTERKPPGMSFESWVDKQVREAAERGDMDDLPGAGKPLPGLNKPRDELWWIRQKVADEGIPADTLLPTPLRLRKEIERLPDQVRALRSEDDVRAAVAELNRRIAEWLRAPSGPPIQVRPVDPDEIVAGWRAARPAAEPAPAPRQAAGQDAAQSRPSWWRRVLGLRER